MNDKKMSVGSAKIINKLSTEEIHQLVSDGILPKPVWGFLQGVRLFAEGKPLKYSRYLVDCSDVKQVGNYLPIFEATTSRIFEPERKEIILKIDVDEFMNEREIIEFVQQQFNKHGDIYIKEVGKCD